jgi:hypothetical protein
MITEEEARECHEGEAGAYKDTQASIDGKHLDGKHLEHACVGRARIVVSH